MRQHQEEASEQLPKMDLEVKRAMASECEAFGVGEGKTAIFPGVASGRRCLISCA